MKSNKARERGRSKKNVLTFTTALASAAAIMSGMAATNAVAQEAAASDEEVVVVTGTLLRRAETASPVTTLSAQDLDDRGIVTISDAVLNVAANNAGTIPQNWNVGWNFATGATAVSLRGLTVSSTVTLFDGNRMAPYPLADDGRRNFADLNAIPQGIIERIEVLKDGASSTYGADAIAGVVNVITFREIQGLHVNASIGQSQDGLGAEQRLGLTMGYGDLDDDGFNAYIGIEYANEDGIRTKDLDYPFNDWDWSQYCNDAGNCLFNANRNAVQSDGSFGLSGVGTDTPIHRAYNGSPVTLTDPNGVDHEFGPGELLLNQYELANLAAGCGPGLITHNLTDAQRRAVTPFAYDEESDTYEPTGYGYEGFDRGQVQCEQNVYGDYTFNSPDVDRLGVASRFSFKLGDSAEVYARADWYQVRTYSELYPLGFASNTTPPGNITFSPVLLPAYVCPLEFETCDAMNGTLNTANNPYAASGDLARVIGTWARPRTSDAQADTFRFGMGIDGTLEDVWNYSASVTASHVSLQRANNGYAHLQSLIDAIHTGNFNFLDQSQNTEEQINAIMPEVTNTSTSTLYAAQATISRELFELPGGPLTAAIGAAWREEKIDNPSFNPANEAHPTERYYGINSVGAEGSRNVWGEFFEIDAPVLPILNINLSGRYDSYSSGQSQFSPKIGFMLTPIDQLTFRGTYSEGFRIPSFNEAYGLPTTGYITQGIDALDPIYADFIAAHNGNAYASGTYSVGLTSTGNAALDPEESHSHTFGVVFEPMRNLTLSMDYWKITVENLITNANYAPAIDEYYANNGVVNLPGITVIPAAPDLEYPNALPLLGFIEYSYQNANSQEVSGVDFSARYTQEVFGGHVWSSTLDVAYLENYEKTYDEEQGGGTESYAGTLSPCDVTSCSGAPQWRWNWANTLDLGNTSLTLTAYYTSSYDFASTDYGGVEGDCENNYFASVYPYDVGPGANITPYACESDKVLYFDFTANHTFNDRVQVYTNIYNVFDQETTFDPSSAYHIYGYNPVWQSGTLLGRYFRVGVKVDF